MTGQQPSGVSAPGAAEARYSLPWNAVDFLNPPTSLSWGLRGRAYLTPPLSQPPSPREPRLESVSERRAHSPSSGRSHADPMEEAAADGGCSNGEGNYPSCVDVGGGTANEFLDSSVDGNPIRCCGV